MWAGDWTKNLAELFEEKEALLEVKTGTRVSYRKLAARVDAMARVLVSLGVKQGDRVAILAKNRLEHLDLLFATARLGALYAPLNWRMAAPELSFVLDDLEPAALFFDAEHAFVAGKILAQAHAQAVALDTPRPTDEDTPQAAVVLADRLAEVSGAPEVAQAPLSLNDVWVVLYTSGTTGRPKGALLPHRQVAFNALNTIVALGLTADDRTVTYTPMFHTGALHVLTTPLLSCGGSVVLDDGFDADRCLGLTAEERCTLLFGVPTTFEMMSVAPRFADTDLGHVRVALCGGAPCPKSLIETYAQRGIKFKQGYGLTEVGPNCLNLRVEDIDKKRGAAGRPNLHIQARVVDERGDVVTGPGRGELLLGGPCVCAGYWRRPDATKDALSDDGFFRTGDVVERDADGFYTIVDRKKDMFISGGENVYPAEVEKALSDHPQVRAAAVVGVPDEKWGEVGRAYLEVTDKDAVAQETLRDWLKQRLATYKVPKEFVVVDELPRNPSGKVQKHRLGERA